MPLCETSLPQVVFVFKGKPEPTDNEAKGLTGLWIRMTAPLPVLPRATDSLLFRSRGPRELGSSLRGPREESAGSSR